MGCINSKNKNQSEPTYSQGYDNPNCEKEPPVTARSRYKREDTYSPDIEMQELRNSNFDEADTSIDRNNEAESPMDATSSSNAGGTAEVDTGQNNKAKSQLDATSSNDRGNEIKQKAKSKKEQAPPAPTVSSGTPEHHRPRSDGSSENVSTSYAEDVQLEEKDTQELTAGEQDNKRSEHLTSEKKEPENSKNRKKKETNARKVDKLKTKIDDLERQQAENEHRIKEEQQRSERFMREKKELEQQIKDGKNKFDRLGQKHARERTRLQDLETELEQTKTRLSQFIATRLTDNNPNIADLSDSNRPTKLAEYYSELYDNQWTEAYAELEDNRTEEETCCLLLDILLVSYGECRRQADQDLTSLIDVYKQFCQLEPSTQVTKPIKEVRKRNFQKHTENMKKVIEDVLKKKFPDIALGNDVLKYVHRCTELCWLMVIQDPPVHIDKEVQIAGQTFSKDIFRHYTESGKYVKYVVWPVLYLVENGAVLSKGIAQGMRQPVANESVQYIGSDTSEYVDTTQEPVRKGPNKADKVENIKSTHLSSHDTLSVHAEMDENNESKLVTGNGCPLHTTGETNCHHENDIEKPVNQSDNEVCDEHSADLTTVKSSQRDSTPRGTDIGTSSTNKGGNDADSLTELGADEALRDTKPKENKLTKSIHGQTTGFGTSPAKRGRKQPSNLNGNQQFMNNKTGTTTKSMEPSKLLAKKRSTESTRAEQREQTMSPTQSEGKDPAKTTPKKKGESMAEKPPVQKSRLSTTPNAQIKPPPSEANRTVKGSPLPRNKLSPITTHL